MGNLSHRSKVRRAERKHATSSGSINLVPLIDILVSVVFFSLLTYTGQTMAQLTAFDLTLPPRVVPVAEPKPVGTPPEAATLLLAVKIEPNRLRVEHSEEGGYRQDIPGLDGASLDQLQALMEQIRAKYPQNADVMVVPSDEVSYDNVVKVLERLRIARYAGISLASRERAAQQMQARTRAGS